MTRHFIITLALVAALLPASLQAARRKSTEAVIVALTADSITIRNGIHPGYKIVVIEFDGDKKTMPAANIDKYTLKPWTTITLNGLPAKFTDLKPGMKVRVSQSTDPSVAHSITAVVVPPPQQADATDKLPPPKGKGPRKLSQGIDAYKVTAVSAGMITVAQDGGKKSINYKMGNFTEIFVNGAKSSLDKVKVGMEVAVVAGTDPAIAASIRANNPD